MSCDSGPGDRGERGLLRWCFIFQKKSMVTLSGVFSGSLGGFLSKEREGKKTKEKERHGKRRKSNEARGGLLPRPALCFMDRSAPLPRKAQQVIGASPGLPRGPWRASRDPLGPAQASSGRPSPALAAPGRGVHLFVVRHRLVPVMGDDHPQPLQFGRLARHHTS